MQFYNDALKIVIQYAQFLDKGGSPDIELQLHAFVKQPAIYNEWRQRLVAEAMKVINGQEKRS